MEMCGFHLRCWNIGIKCPECKDRQVDPNKDYLSDALNVLPKCDGADYGTEPDFSYKVEK